MTLVSKTAHWQARQKNYTTMKTLQKPDDGRQLHAYLIRLWSDGCREPWRASAKQVSDGSEVHFASLEQLFLYLHQQTVAGAQAGASAERGE